jgi:hypothetical protein
MPVYRGLTQMVGRMTSDNADAIFAEQVIPYLVEVWRSGYERGAGAAGSTSLVQRTVSRVSYLFDVQAGRLVASWTLARGERVGARSVPPTLQFTYWDYDAPMGPVPSVEQGVLAAGRPPVITTYPEHGLRAAC